MDLSYISSRETRLCLKYRSVRVIVALQFEQHYGSLKPYFYGVSAFDISRKELLEILKEHNNGKIDEESEATVY